jgi:hypothetical protein
MATATATMTATATATAPPLKTPRGTPRGTGTGGTGGTGRIEIIDYIPPRLVPKYRGLIQGYVEGSLKYMHGEYAAEDIFEALSSGQWGLSLVWRCADGRSACLGFYATAVVIYPQLRALRIMALGGRELKRWKKPAMQRLAEMQARNGCERVESFGRKGWLRMLPGKFDVGYYYLATDLRGRRGTGT